MEFPPNVRDYGKVRQFFPTSVCLKVQKGGIQGVEITFPSHPTGRRLLQAPSLSGGHQGPGGGEAQPQHEGPDQPHEGEVPGQVPAPETLHQDANGQQQQHTKGTLHLLTQGQQVIVNMVMEAHLRFWKFGIFFNNK